MSLHYSGPTTEEGVSEILELQKQELLDEVQYEPELRKDVVLILREIRRAFDQMVLQNAEEDSPYRRKKRKDEHCQAPEPVTLSREQILTLGLALRRLHSIVRNRLAESLQQRLHSRLYAQGQSRFHPEVHSALEN